MIITVTTGSRTQMKDITDQVRQVVTSSGIQNGLVHVCSLHTTGAVTINENADPTVREDFKNFEEKLVPRNFPYKHDYEGPDDMPAHIKSSLFGCELSIPISNGRLALGAWQGIYLCEHRDYPHSRKIILTAMS